MTVTEQFKDAIEADFTVEPAPTPPKPTPKTQKVEARREPRDRSNGMMSGSFFYVTGSSRSLVQSAVRVQNAVKDVQNAAQQGTMGPMDEKEARIVKGIFDEFGVQL